MAQLLSLSQQQAIKRISPNWAIAQKEPDGNTNYNQLAIEVQEYYLPQLLGRAFAYDIMENDESYTTLLDGGEFTDCEGNLSYFKGLRYCLAYYNYAKFVNDSRMEDTFSGMVYKNRNESTAIQASDVTRLQQEARNIAELEMEQLKVFLELNSSDYPLWNCTAKRKPYQPKIINVRKYGE